MIHGMLIARRDGQVPDPLGDYVGLLHTYLFEQHIQVALTPVPRLPHKPWTVRESLEHYKLQTGCVERGSDFTIRVLDPSPSLPHIRQVAIDSRSHPIGQVLGARKAKRQS